MVARKKRVKKKVLFVTLLLILFIGASIAGVSIYKNKKPAKKPAKDTQGVIKKEEEKEKVYTAKFIAAGDALIHNAVRYSALQSDGTFDFNSEFDMIRDIISGYDIKFYNQESMINGNDSSYPSGGGLYFNTPTAYGTAALNAGFNLVSLANNHSMDTGVNGVLGSVNYWKSKDGIIFDGMTDSEEMRNDYTRLIGEVNNIKYGFLAYTTSTNGNPVPQNKSYLVNTYNEEKVKKDIEALRDKVDVLIVSMHWGIEYILEPNAEEKKIAKFLADNNVDIVIGNHAHCIQPIEKINNTVVYYALGNLMSNQGYLTSKFPNKYGQKVTIGALGNLTITKKVKKTGETEINLSDIGAELLYTYSTTPGSNLRKDREYITIPFSKMTNEYLTITTSEYKNNLPKLYEDYKAVLQKYDSTINVAPLNKDI